MKTPTRLRQTIGKPIGQWVISDEDILAIQTDARAELEAELKRGEAEYAKLRFALWKVVSEHKNSPQFESEIDELVHESWTQFDAMREILDDVGCRGNHAPGTGTYCPCCRWAAMKGEMKI